MENGVVIDEASARLDVRFDRDWALAVASSFARFNLDRDDPGSHRTLVSTTLTRRISDRFFIVLGTRAFGFDEDVNGGFFDPDFYGIVDVALAWRREGNHVTLEADAAPGVQRVGSHGDLTGALRATATLTIAVRPGRSVSVRGTWANTGLQDLSANAGNDYRYRGVSMGMNWWF